MYSDLVYFKNINLNLGLPTIKLMNPSKPLKLNDSIYTVWDNITLKGPLKLKEFINYFKETHNSELVCASIGDLAIYHKTMAEEYKVFFETFIEEEYQKISGKSLESSVKEFEILAEAIHDKTREKNILPSIRYSF